jgi:uncharacterized protein (TIGR00369 family)
MKQFQTGVVPLEAIMSRSGLEFLTDMAQGKIPQAPMCATLGFHLVEVSEGFAAFEGLPEFRHYNPIGTVHGGYAATLLDSALGSAVHTTLPAGVGYTTLTLEVKMVRAITRDIERVRVEAEVLHRGRKQATAQARLTDAATGKLLAHGTSTCLILGNG